MNQVTSKLDTIREEFEIELAKSTDLNKLQIEYLGRKSKLNKLLKGIKELKPEQRAETGKIANQLRNDIEAAIDKKQKEIKAQKYKKLASKEWIDVTIPGKTPDKGSLHPITQMINKTTEIFQEMGFEVYLPFEVDDDYHNFETVNMPKDHPARDAWDTFWTEDENVLITHTSSMQNRILKDKEPPVRAVVPGKCFRNEATDARHEHTFYQLEGIYVDKGIKLTDMLGTLEAYFETFFEKDIDVKFMPDFFPFVEPGGQMALSCVLCDGKGCKVCKGSGWLEILGCGMVHPNVLEMAGIDSNIYSGFAWGFGIERLIMLKNNINDIRLFHNADLRFLNQFK